jgi:hypothetical protein
MEDKIDIIYWRIGLRELYSVDMISQEEFLCMYDRDFLYQDYLSNKEYDIAKFIVGMVSDVDSFQQIINEEMVFVFGGKPPKNKKSFKKHWLFHLAGCLEEGHIDEEDFSNLINGIDFNNSEWNEDEEMKLNTILDMIRITMLSKSSSSIEYFENPSFEVLMFVNDMSVEND